MNKYFLAKKIVITNKLGLHARPAGMIAKLAAEAYSKIWIEKDGKKADASMIPDVLMLFCPQGVELTIGIEKEKDIDILNKIIDLIQNNFKE
jgi:phosphocarrier protein HPr